MLNNIGWYAWVILALAILAGLLGFGFVASAAAGIAKLLFYVFVAAFVIVLLSTMTRRA